MITHTHIAQNYLSQNANTSVLFIKICHENLKDGLFQMMHQVKKSICVISCPISSPSVTLQIVLYYRPSQADKPLVDIVNGVYLLPFRFVATH
jgi:hypothetical protein